MDVGLNTFEVKPEVSRDFYSEIEIPVQIQASFHEALTFFDQLGKMERIINVKNVRFSSPTVKEEKVLLTVDFIAMTYRFLKSPTEAPPPASESTAEQAVKKEGESGGNESQETDAETPAGERKRGRER